MLGCQDFCGYYDWTFAHVRQNLGGDAAVQHLWAEAIGKDSQSHYIEAGRGAGLRGLFDQWTDTGRAEHCDWTFTLDEQRNVLRWDMRKCPSKGFLLQNDLNADQDYCDHCMGWEIPMLQRLGIEVAAHEHNHCGQCWGEFRIKGQPYQSLDLPCDIRKSPDWNNGYLDSWRDNEKQIADTASGLSDDTQRVLERRFAGASEIVILGRGPSAVESWAKGLELLHVIVSGPTYARRDVFAGDPSAVLISTPPTDLEPIARRYLDTDPRCRPVLLYPYLPRIEPCDFAGFGLPRPLPILPMLIRSNLYCHQPMLPIPTTGVFMVMLAIAIGKPVAVAGIDLYAHPSGRDYVIDGPPVPPGSASAWPDLHSYQCDTRHLLRCRAHAGARLRLSPGLCALLDSLRPKSA